jgi:hypothetical protein
MIRYCKPKISRLVTKNSGFVLLIFIAIQVYVSEIIVEIFHVDSVQQQTAIWRNSRIKLPAELQYKIMTSTN